MPLVVSDSTDQQILDYIFEQLNARLGTIDAGSTDALLEALAPLPRGLRAMAATHELDVSVALDGLGWHFLNWPSLAWADETKAGLNELEATEVATIFSQALDAVARRWATFTDHLNEPADFYAWYDESGLATELDPLDDQLSAILTPESQGMYQFWITYARKYPDRLG